MRIKHYQTVVRIKQVDMESTTNRAQCIVEILAIGTVFFVSFTVYESTSTQQGLKQLLNRMHEFQFTEACASPVYIA